MSGLLGAGFVAVNRAGHVEGRPVALGNNFAVGIPDDKTIDIELLERRVEIEFQCAELLDALRVLNLDLLDVGLGDVVAAIEFVADDAVDVERTVAIHRHAVRRSGHHQFH